ncbi:ribosome small subunit-dependent GTPase A [Ferrimonas pelagia]|uniref:Small ribosomal subunit biogenesis GTPase RsgA n=1 Tax=Ferrimonas pelagia TaxID=1177826 RepID=A0ABP9FKQ2_9GAMM
MCPDHSKITTDANNQPASKPMTLAQLGWRPFFGQQITLEQWDFPALRVVAQHRNRLELLGELGPVDLELTPNMPAITVGDWLQLSPEGRFEALLERQSLFRRKAAGSKVAEQLIAANVDTLFIVMSLNDDFNLSRVERYLSLANEADAEPVIVLTKADLCADPDAMKRQVQGLDPLLMVETINGLDAAQIDKLLPWCGSGQTVAFMGSSGVGKSTLVNTLLGGAVQETGGIREDDSKGRHTTTGRSLHPMAQGGLLLDTPGMRELQLADCDEGVNATFADITALAGQCRFGDCQHGNEPGCAVQAAIDSGELEPRRLTSFQKLMREQALNSATLAQKRAKDKAFQKHINATQSQARRFKKG